MSTPNGQPFNYAADYAQVGVQAQWVTIEGDVKMTAAPGEPPEAKYQAGVANLNSRNPEQARELIWDAMMGWKAAGSRQATSEVVFHWLVAMLSGRTVRQFTGPEISRLQQFRPACTEARADEWAQGVQLIYQLLDSALQPPGGTRQPHASTRIPVTDFDSLGQEQREMLHPLDLFLSGPRRDEMWRDELKAAQAEQGSVDRRARAWMFFHPDPVKVTFPEPPPVPGAAASRWRMRASVLLFAALTACIGYGLIRQGAVLALFGCVAGLASGIAAAAGDLETHARPERRYLVQPATPPAGGDTADLSKRIGKLFQKYFEKYEPVESSRRLWEQATVEARRFYQEEITAICLANNYSVDRVTWLIRHEVRQMNQRWRDGTPQFPRHLPAPRRGALTARRAGLAVLVLGFALAVLEARAYTPGFAVVLVSAIVAWRCWLRVSLELPDSSDHNQRQEEADEARRRWSRRLEERPKDAQMAAWLEHDHTVLLGMALEHFNLPRSTMIAHGFIEKPFPGARRSQATGGLPRYQKYTIWMFLLAEGGVHQLRATLNSLTGTLVEREHISYGYTSIAAVRMLRKTGGVRTYELSLTAGEPIKVRVRETDPSPLTQDDHDDSEPAKETETATEDAAPDVAAVTNTLRLLQGVVGGGMNWLHDHNWANAWKGSQIG